MSSCPSRYQQAGNCMHGSILEHDLMPIRALAHGARRGERHRRQFLRRAGWLRRISPARPISQATDRPRHLALHVLPLVRRVGYLYDLA